jgi:hypothetical protein
MLIVTTTKGEPGPPAVSLLGVRTDDAKRCVAHRILKSEGRYAKHLEVGGGDRSTRRQRLKAEEGPMSTGDGDESAVGEAGGAAL